MGFDAGKLKGLSGILRLLSIVCAFLAICCYFFRSSYGALTYGAYAFSGGLLTFFIGSLIFLLLLLLVGENKILGIIDAVFHIWAALHMIIVSCINLYHLGTWFGSGMSIFEQEIAASFFALLYGILCIAIAVLFFRGNK